MVMAYAKKYLPKITIIPAQGTYLLWLDCHQLGMSDELLHQFFLEKAKLALQPLPILWLPAVSRMRKFILQ
jgi:cystathionine beta-lyase